MFRLATLLAGLLTIGVFEGCKSNADIAATEVVTEDEVPITLDVSDEDNDDFDLEIDLIGDDDDDDEGWIADPRDKWRHEQWPACKDDVLYLSDETWEAEIEKYPLVIVSFCNTEKENEEVCSQFDHEFRAALDRLNGPSYRRMNPVGFNTSFHGMPWCGPVKFAYVDSIQNLEMRRRFHLTTFPRVAMFKEGQPWMMDMKVNKEWNAIYNTVIEIGVSTEGFKEYYQEPSDPDIVDIHSNKQLDELAAEHKMVLAEFYAPWCGYCQDFFPKYGEAARLYNKHHKVEVPFVRIGSDGPGKKEMMAKFGITGYPTFMVFYQGSPFKYIGGHEPQHFGWELDNFFPYEDRKVVAMDPDEEDAMPIDVDAVIELNAENFNATLVGNSNTNAVFFYAPWCAHCKKLHKPWDQAATYLKSHFPKADAVLLKMDATDPSAKTIAEMYGVTGYPTVMFFKETQPYLYRGKRTVGGIVNHLRFWAPNDQDRFKFTFEGMTEEMKTKGDPNDVEILNDADFEETVLESKDSWLLKFYAPWCGHCKKLAPEWEKAATKTEGRVRFGTIDCTINSEICAKYNVKGYPTLFSYDFNAGEKTFQNAVVYEGERKFDGLVHFANTLGFNDEGQVIALTANSFRQAVFDRVLGPEPWMMEFYAPWCGHCKQLAPHWSRAARTLGGKVRFGKVDATAETALATEYNIEGMPTILFFPTQDPNDAPLSYNGMDRTASSIVAYVREQIDTKDTEADVGVEITTATLEVGADGEIA